MTEHWSLYLLALIGWVTICCGAYVLVALLGWVGVAVLVAAAAMTAIMPKDVPPQ